MTVRRLGSVGRAFAVFLVALPAMWAVAACTGDPADGVRDQRTASSARPDRSAPGPDRGNGPGSKDPGRNVAGGPARTPPPRTGPVAALGRTTTLKGIDSTIAMTVTKILDPARPTDEYLKPDGRYVGIRLQIRNTGGSAYGDSPSNGAILIDARGEAHHADFVTITAGQDIGSPRLRPGDRRAGWLVFDVPEGVEPTRFQYTVDSGLGDRMAEWKLS